MRRDPDATGIYKRGEVYWLAFQRNRKRSFVSLETGDYSEAIERAREMRSNPELNDGGLLKHEIPRFIAWKLKAEEFSRQTAHNSQLFLDHLPRIIGNKAPFQVTPAQAAQFYTTLRARMTESSAQTYVAHARSFFQWCVETEHLCRSNPFADMEMPELIPVARKEFCTPDLRDKLLNECPRDDLRFILFCGFHTAMRRNEIVEARPAWFDLRQKIVTIRKISPADAERTGLDPFDLKDREERTIPLSKAFAAFLKQWLNPEADYCLDPKGRRGKSRYRYDFIRFFREYMTAQKCPWVTPHTMRRTFGSIQASKGTSIYLIAQWLGDDIETTRKHYGHLIPAHKTLEKGL
jgi:integrase